jgi:thioredoxin-related protein
MRNILVLLVFALAALLPPAASRAGLDVETGAIPADGFELIVVEADGCIYCGLFRRDVLPGYEASEQGKEVPVRFVDVNDVEAVHLALKTAVDIVPTFVVVKSQQEIGRISGYMGPEDFFHSIKYLLDTAP